MLNVPLLISDMLSPVKGTRKSAENAYLNLPVVDKILVLRKCTKEDCLRFVRSGHVKETIFPTVLYHILRKELVDGIYPRFDIEGKSFFGRKIGIFEEEYTYMQNYITRGAAFFAHKQYTLFDETLAMGSRFNSFVTRAFLLGLHKNNFLGMKGSLVNDLKRNMSSLEVNLYRMENELDAAFREILALDIRENRPERLCLLVCALEVSASLLSRQIARKDNTLIGIFSKLMLSALKKVRLGFKEADIDCIDELVTVNYTNLCLVAMINPTFVIPGCEDLYGITIQVMAWQHKACDFIRAAFLEIFVTFAENCPEEIKYIGQKEYKLCNDKESLTYEGCLISTVLNHIRSQNQHHDVLDFSDDKYAEHAVREFDTCDGDSCRASMTRLLEPVRNLERFARVVGAKKMWPHIQSLLKEINSKSSGLSIYAALITISYMGDIFKDEIAASHKLIKEVMNIAFVCDSPSMVKVATCLVNIQLATDIGKSFVRSWQSEAYMTTLLKLIMNPTARCTIPSIFVLRAITSCAECEFPEIQNPAFKKYLPKIINAVNYLLGAYISENVHIQVIEVRVQAVKAICALVRAGGSLVKKGQVKLCRRLVYKHITKHALEAKNRCPFRNMTYIQQVFFEALIQLSDYGHRPSSILGIKRCLKNIFDDDFFPDFRLEFGDHLYEMSAGTCPFISVAVLANTSPSSLIMFRPIFLPKMNNILQLAAREYLDIFKEYTLCNFIPVVKEPASRFVTVQECIKGKENACRFILSVAKYHCDYFEGVGLQKVIDTMLMNLTDRMCSATQELASEALPFLLEKFMHANYLIFSRCMYRKVLRCFMEAASNQINPLKCLRLLLKMIGIYKNLEEPGISSKLVDKKMNNLVLLKLKYADNFIATHRRGNFINDFVMPKAYHMEEIKKLTMEVRNVFLH